MASIKIKNFGPIKNGYTEGDGFIPIQKYMTFIGNQGSGKSSVVKLISTFSWLEKALFQGKTTIDELKRLDYFKMYLGHQQIENYLQPTNLMDEGSFLEYRGDTFYFRYERNKLEITSDNLLNYKLPKITFIPAERNFLSVVEEAEEVKQLPSTLKWCLEEFIKACRILNAPIGLPINRLNFSYNKDERRAYIHGEDDKYSIKLSEASSGIQSVAPLFIVLDFLNKSISNQKDASYSAKEREKLRIEFEELLKKDYPTELKDEAYKVLFGKFTINHLLNIVEEIEQNLFPDSQRAILNKALEFAEKIIDNKLILTTHSPYIIGYLTLAMKGYLLKERVMGNPKLEEKLAEVVPLSSCINPEDAGVYELDLEGKIHRVEIRNGFISGKNYLNEKMKEENTLFDKLLEIEEELE